MSKNNNNNDNSYSQSDVFHEGERSIQERVGVSTEFNQMSRQAVTSFMSMQHQVFFAKLPMIFIAAADREGNIWSSVLYGQPGFINITDIQHFTINAQFHNIDPLYRNIKTDSSIGLLGIQFETRRRNRVNTTATKLTNSSLTMKVNQCYGNCPKYIQRCKRINIDTELNPESVEFNAFDKTLTSFIKSTDTLFIGSTSDAGDANENKGVDCSHRGGMAGFVHVPDSNTLLIPDYIGNNFFNTLGNISLNPKVGIQFLDYKNGDRVMLTGEATIVWAEDEALPFDGADRMIKFTLKKGYLLKNCFPFEWQLESYSPFSKAYLPEES